MDRLLARLDGERKLWASGAAFAPGSADIEALVFQLRSSDQKSRDAAAAELRNSYVPTTRSRWEPLVASIKPRTAKAALRQLLQPARLQSGEGTGQSHMEEYSLDDCWKVRCWFSNADDTLLSIELIEFMRSIWVKPQEKFTGVWTTYFVNGQKSHDIQYKDGKYDGTFTPYHSNGSKAYVQRYVDHVIDGEDVGYFPTGQIQYRGNYRAGRQVGTWTRYSEDGSVRSKQEFTAESQQGTLNKPKESIIRLAQETAEKVGRHLSDYSAPVARPLANRKGWTWVVRFDGKTRAKGNYFDVWVNDQTGKTELTPGK
jgi:antitoxin component YwqK of YwqJK toxin-antitoxin module